MSRLSGTQRRRQNNHCAHEVLFSKTTDGELTVAGLSVRTQAREIKSLVGLHPKKTTLTPTSAYLKPHSLRPYFDIPKEEAQDAREAIKFFQLEEKKDVPILALSRG
jgi:ABC-type multidrug transport system ATPase subunit